MINFCFPEIYVKMDMTELNAFVRWFYVEL